MTQSMEVSFQMLLPCKLLGAKQYRRAVIDRSLANVVGIVDSYGTLGTLEAPRTGAHRFG